MKVIGSSLAVSAVLLAGCGGSGGNNDAVVQPKQGDAAVIEFNNNSQLNSGTNTQSFKASADRNALLGGDTAAGLESIVINGKKISLISGSKSNAVYNYVNDGGVKVVSSGDFLSYSRFAVLAIPGYSSLANTYIGVPISATDMPQTGSANYSGKGLHILKSNNTVVETDVTAEVDFAHHKGLVNIQGDQIPKFTIHGNIQGNGLVNNSDSVVLNAKFYGEQARELTGQYFRVDDAGVFGASKK